MHFDEVNIYFNYYPLLVLEITKLSSRIKKNPSLKWDIHSIWKSQNSKIKKRKRSKIKIKNICIERI